MARRGGPRRCQGGPLIESAGDRSRPFRDAGVAEDAEFETEFAPGEALPPLSAAVQRNLEKRTVSEIMVGRPVTVAANTPLTEVACLLSEKHIHRVIVMDGAAVCGVVSVLDLVRLMATGAFREV
jgi:CBS domain-containing protein